MCVYMRDQLIALRRYAVPFDDAARRVVLSAGGVARHRRLRGCRDGRRKQAVVNWRRAPVTDKRRPPASFASRARRQAFDNDRGPARYLRMAECSLAKL